MKFGQIQKLETPQTNSKQTLQKIEMGNVSKRKQLSKQ